MTTTTGPDGQRRNRSPKLEERRAWFSAERAADEIDSGEPEVTTPLTKRQATLLDNKIRGYADYVVLHVGEIKKMLAKAKAGQVHITLGYKSWTAYVADALGGRLQVTEPVRKDIIKVLAGEGMSQRAIAKAVNVSQKTVDRDLDQLSHDDSVDQPDKVVSLDGRRRPAKGKTKTIEFVDTGGHGGSVREQLAKTYTDANEQRAADAITEIEVHAASLVQHVATLQKSGLPDDGGVSVGQVRNAVLTLGNIMLDLQALLPAKAETP
jgi:hypothetical protein